MNYILDFIIFTTATLTVCVIDNIIKIKIERRLGIAKKPWLMFIRYTPGYFNYIIHVSILFAALLFASQMMHVSQEYIFIPLILILVTKLFLTKRPVNTTYFEAIGLTAIMAFVLPTLLEYHSLDVLSFISAAVAVKIFNINTEEPLPLNAARNITLNSYIIFVIFPNTDFVFCMLFAVVLSGLQQITYTIIPAFNNLRNMRRIFRWGIMLALSILIINTVIAIITRG